MTQSNIVFGCGYLGRRVADRWRDTGIAVQVVTRDTERAAALRKAGFQAHVADVTRPVSLKPLVEASTVLFAVGYDRESRDSIEEVYVDGLANVLDALSGSVKRFIYISSTGVYGPSSNGWLNEDSACKPTRAAGKACLAAERLLQAHPLGARSIILRLAGMYGPGRVPQRSALAAGQATAPPLDSYLNLIHIDDAVTFVLAAETHAEVPNTFVISDGNPVMRRDYYREVLRLAKLDDNLIKQIKLSDTDRGREVRASRGGKRVSNAKMLRELPASLAYPDYRAGLAQAMRAG